MAPLAQARTPIPTARGKLRRSGGLITLSFGGYEGALIQVSLKKDVYETRGASVRCSEHLMKPFWVMKVTSKGNYSEMTRRPWEDKQHI